MSLSRYLEEIISHIQKSQLPPPFRDQVISALTYFKQQTLCDLDRRDSQATIRQRWAAFEAMIVGTSLLDGYRREKSRWPVLEAFMGFPSSAEMAAPKYPIGQKRSRLSGKDAEMLFELLAMDSEKKKHLSEIELNLVRFGLYYLFLEVRRGRAQRDKNRIKFTWKVIQPILRRMGMLDEFDTDLEAKKKLTSFISDRFL